MIVCSRSCGLRRLGRLLAAEETREGAPGFALLSHRVWTDRFASDPDIACAPIELDGEPHTVSRRGRRGGSRSEPRGGSLDAYGHVVLRAGPGMRKAAPSLSPSRSPSRPWGASAAASPREQAAAEVETLLRPPDTGDSRTSEDRPQDRSRDFVARVVPQQGEMTSEQRPAPRVLSAAAVLVLLTRPFASTSKDPDGPFSTDSGPSPKHLPSEADSSGATCRDDTSSTVQDVL